MNDREKMDVVKCIVLADQEWLEKYRLFLIKEFLESNPPDFKKSDDG